MFSMQFIRRVTLCAALALASTAMAEEFFDDFSYAGGASVDGTDPQFQCFGWYVRTGGGGPGPTQATWRADYVSWADDPALPGNRVMQLRASTNGTGSGTFQSEVDSNADIFHEGTYGVRIKYVDPVAGAGQPSVQAFTTYKGLLCDINYSECDIEYATLDPWSTRCGSQPAFHFQTWEQYCEAPYLADLTPAQPSPICGSLAGWHTLTMIVSNGTVRYYLDGLLKATHGGAYYPETPMRVLLLHWISEPLNPGVAADMSMEVDWIHYTKDTVLSPAQVESQVVQLRSAGVLRRNTIESFPDCNSNGIPDYCEPDSDGDGIIDECDTTKVWRVDWKASGAGTGLSWTDAFANLHTALAAAQPGDEIWVAAGTYHPAPPGGDRNLAFHLTSGVAVFGGFSGTESQRSQRDRVLNPTLLSGDLNGNDAPSFTNIDENSFCVVDGSGVSSSTILDGFTVTGANGTYAGGLFLDGGSPVVRFCNFVGNSASFGGAICMHESTPTIVRCYFGANRASTDGGALYVDLGSSPHISACVFEHNEAGYAGGAARILTSSPLFVSCTFRGNKAQYGGAIQHYESSGPMIANSLLSGNFASGAGGAVHNTNSSPFVVNCTVAGNSATTGGGLLGWPPSMAVVANTIFWGNSDATGNGEQAQITADTALVSYSCIQNWTGLGSGVGILNADPLFVDADGLDDLPGTEDDNYRLRTHSPGIDAGDNTMMPPDVTDLDGDGNTSEPIALDVAGYRRLEDALLVPDTGFGAAPLVDLGPYEYVAVSPADFDYDRDVDGIDLQHLATCARGPGVPYASFSCKDADLDADEDVDQVDFAILQRSYGVLE
jgi:hypothetical protein